MEGAKDVVRSVEIIQADGDSSLMTIEKRRRSNDPTRRRGITAIVLWLIFLLACVCVISRTHFTTDLSAFLPRAPTPEQQLLMDQLSDGLASRLILVGIEGADAPTRARLSAQLAQRLRADPSLSALITASPSTPSATVLSCSTIVTC